MNHQRQASAPLPNADETGLPGSVTQLTPTMVR